MSANGRYKECDKIENQGCRGKRASIPTVHGRSTGNENVVGCFSTSFHARRCGDEPGTGIRCVVTAGFVGRRKRQILGFY